MIDIFRASGCVEGHRDDATPLRVICWQNISAERSRRSVQLLDAGRGGWRDVAGSLVVRSALACMLENASPPCVTGDAIVWRTLPTSLVLSGSFIVDGHVKTMSGQVACSRGPS